MEKPAQKKPGRPRSLSDGEILTLLVWNTLMLHQKTLKDLHRFVSLYHKNDFPVFPKYSGFVALCHKTLPQCFELLTILLDTKASVRIMDATMLPVCKLHRVDSYKVAKNIAAFGKNWQGWHYGFKLHASINLSGALSGLALTPASVYDAQMEHLLLNEHARVAVGDTLYGASVMRKRMWRRYGTVIIAPPHPKQKKKLTAPWQIELLNIRSKIESVFDYLKEHLHLVSSFPRSVSGYLVHYVRILLAYQIMALSQWE
ncbi:MAG: IS982 family transposase [Parcubacteria group bacterium]|nr:IS982 family transposase [Parcubacteria group bacterium]